MTSCGHPGHCVSWQVKSTTAESGGGYACATRRQGKPYLRGPSDFVAAYVVQEDVWYIIQAGKVTGKKYRWVWARTPSMPSMNHTAKLGVCCGKRGRWGRMLRAWRRMCRHQFGSATQTESDAYFRQQDAIRKSGSGI
jgi:hypothetical protein